MVGIIYCSDLNRAPFIQKYIDIMNKCDCEYRIILWDRSGTRNEYPASCIVYDKVSDLYDKKCKKLLPFIGFSRFVRNVINNYKFRKLIVLTTFSAIVILPLLYSKYKNRFIFDFRDLSYERLFAFRCLVKGIAKKSYFTCVSSPQFKVFVGSNTVISHNFKYSDLKNTKKEEFNVHEQINLLHIGISRGDEYNKKIIDVFGGDDRFTVTIAGSGNNTENVLNAAQHHSNIHVFGHYDNSQKSSFIERCDALLYYYPCSFNNNTALANKYYDGLIYTKPLIGNENTYSGRRIVKKGIGFSINIEKEDVSTEIYNYLTNLNYKEYYSCVKSELDLILSEDKEYLKKIEEFLRVDV